MCDRPWSHPSAARMKAYAGVGEITWDDEVYRSDIAAE